jgi:hypothetical protein
VTGPSRRFPPPWTVENHNDACFIVKDKNGFAVAYVYYEEEPGRRSAANLMTKDEARAHRSQYRQAAGVIAQAFLIAERNFRPRLAEPPNDCKGRLDEAPAFGRV